jgi:hypothetical protein
MLQLLRRLTVAATLMFWQGGFTFYGAIVVPTGAEVLGGHLEQGFITQRVTNYLNLAGAAALPILAWDLASSSDTVRWRRRLRWAIWGLLVATLAGQVWLHVRLDLLLDAEQHAILDRAAFRWEHRFYLNVSTVQWVAAIFALMLSLVAWRGEDRGLN